MTTAPDTNTADQPSILASPHVRELVCDALTLLDYAIESGFKGEDGRAIQVDTIATVQTTASRLGLIGNALGKDTREYAITASDWVAFELAYYTLATAMRPVTAETLRNTEGTSRILFESTTSMGPRSRWRKLGDVLLGCSPAQRFTRVLWPSVVTSNPASRGHLKSGQLRLQDG